MAVRSMALALALLGCGHACPTVQARLDVSGPPIDDGALAAAREQLGAVPAGARAWHALSARRAAVVEAVERAYRDEGFPRARAGDFQATVAPARDHVAVRVAVRAGPRARWGEVRIRYAAPERPGPRPRAASPEPGWYAESTVDAMVGRLEVFFSERGYPRVVVAARQTVVEGRVDVELLVERGPRLTIEAVELVVAPSRRPRAVDPARLGLVGGELFRRGAVERARERLTAEHSGRPVHWRLVPHEGSPTEATLRFSVQ